MTFFDVLIHVKLYGFMHLQLSYSSKTWLVLIQYVIDPNVDYNVFVLIFNRFAPNAQKSFVVELAKTSSMIVTNV